MSKNIDKDLLESLPVGVLVRSFFVKEWNSFIHIAAKNAEIVWKNEGAITYRRVGDLIAPGETVS